MNDAIHSKQETDISFTTIALALLVLIAIEWFDGFAQKKVKEEIHSENTKKEMRIAIYQRASEEIITNIEEAKKKWTGNIVKLFKNWEVREIEALQAAGDFIDNEVTNEKLYINILKYPGWGLNWCIERYNFELRWGDDRVARFQLNSARQPINLIENKDSEFRKTLEKKAKQAARW